MCVGLLTLRGHPTFPAKFLPVPSAVLSGVEARTPGLLVGLTMRTRGSAAAFGVKEVSGHQACEAPASCRHLPTTLSFTPIVAHPRTSPSLLRRSSYRSQRLAQQEAEHIADDPAPVDPTKMPAAAGGYSGRRVSPQWPTHV